MAVNGLTTAGASVIQANASITRTSAKASKTSATTSQGSIDLTSAEASYESVTLTAEITKASLTTGKTGSAAAVYEKGEGDQNGKVVREHKVDQETIDKLKADAEERHAALRGLVEKLLLKQGGTLDLSKGLANVYRTLEVDEETQKQAQEDIAEDGYWGIEQTSDRILDFAKSLAGEDQELAKSMLEAIKEGFKLAGDDWGEDLPELSQKTIEATYKKVNAWIESLSGSGSGASGSQTGIQASSIKISATYTKASVSASRTQITQKSQQKPQEAIPAEEAPAQIPQEQASAAEDE